MKTPSNKTGPDPWQPCTPGLIKTSLAEVSAGAMAAGAGVDMGRRQMISAVGGGTVVLALGAFAGWSLLNGKKDPLGKPSVFPSEIACVDVIGHLQKYAHGQLNDEALHCTIHLHLKHCPNCSRKFKEIDPNCAKSNSKA